MKAEGMSVRVFKVTLCETVSIIPFSNNLDEVQIPSIVIRKWKRAKSWQSYPKRITILLYLLTSSADCLNLLAINPSFIVQLCWTGKSITGITVAASNYVVLYCQSWLHWFYSHDCGCWIPPVWLSIKPLLKLPPRICGFKKKHHFPHRTLPCTSRNLLWELFPLMKALFRLLWSGCLLMLESKDYSQGFWRVFECCSAALSYYVYETAELWPVV